MKSGKKLKDKDFIQRQNESPMMRKAKRPKEKELPTAKREKEMTAAKSEGSLGGKQGESGIIVDDHMHAIINDPGLSFEDKKQALVMLIMKKMDDDIERAADAATNILSENGQSPASE